MRRTFAFSLFLALGIAVGAEPIENPQPAAEAVAKLMSDQTYKVVYLPNTKLTLDHRSSFASNALYMVRTKANVETNFTFPWESKPAPRTEFRAVCDSESLFFEFEVYDHDIVVLEKLRDEEDEVFEDRLELYFSKDDKLNDYYCIEIDSRGRVFDYRGRFYRKLDTTWSWHGVRAEGGKMKGGYNVWGQIPLASFKELGFGELKPGSKIRFGMYRAEFSHDRSGKKVDQTATLHNLGRKVEGPPPIEQWMSWIDPKVKDPDFHIPATFGWLEIAK